MQLHDRADATSGRRDRRLPCCASCSMSPTSPRSGVDYSLRLGRYLRSESVLRLQVPSKFSPPPTLATWRYLRNLLQTYSSNTLARISFFAPTTPITSGCQNPTLSIARRYWKRLYKKPQTPLMMHRMSHHCFWFSFRKVVRSFTASSPSSFQ